MAAKLSWLGFAQPTLAGWAFGPDQSGCQTKLAGLRSANIGWLGLRPSQKWLPKFKSGCTHVCSVWAFLKPCEQGPMMQEARSPKVQSFNRAI